MKIGLTGGSFAGVSTMFDALTRGAAQSAKGRFQMRVGNAKVPDERLDRLAEMYSPQKVVPGEITYTELPKPVKSNDLFAGEALGVIQKMDALALVARQFQNDVAPHPAGSVDYVRDLEQLLFDMRFQDSDLIDRRIAKIKAESKSLAASKRGDVNRRLDALKHIQEQLDAGISARSQEWGAPELDAVGDAFMVSRLPLLVVVNIDEGSLEKAAEIEAEVNRALDGKNCGVAAVCAQLEWELSQMDADDEGEMREEMGLGETALARFIRLSQSVLGLISFLTVGPDEVRAWPIRDGSGALEGASAIHSDIARGFIRAEVIHYTDLLEAGSLAEGRKRGTLRREGREYRIADGDVINYLFGL